MNWSDWQPLEKQSSHSGPAVYELRMVRGKNNPVSIPRFLACDKNGLLSIGSTTRMESRRKQFICGREKCYGHSEGNLLNLLIKHASLDKRFSGYRLEFRYRPVADKAQAKSAEERLIKEYVREFGEAPPLNSAIPGWYGTWEV
jgi:hypothetical protein